MTASTATGQEPKKLTKAQRRKQLMARVKQSRHLVQLLFAAIILIWAVRHTFEEKSAASTDALCPFGAVETLITYATTGHFISKIHASNMVLGLAVLISVILVGNAFCGWVCPFGSLQDGVHWVKTKLHLPTVTIPAKTDRIMRWGRFVVLGVILYFSATTAKLWFYDYDPYVTAFSLRWLFEFNLEKMWPALLITVLVLGASLLVERFWCRYLCPAGAVFAALGHLSLFRIRRTPACTECTLCDKACPVGLDVMGSQKAVSTDCIGCLDCVVTCPVNEALDLKAGPVFLGSDIPTASRASRAHAEKSQKTGAHS